MFDPPAVAAQSHHLADVLDVIDKATKIFALFVGAGWVYLNYLRGRTFKRRLEPNITSKILFSKGVPFLSGVAQVKNVGLSKVVIQQRGTAIELLELTKRAHEKVVSVRAVRVDVLPVFEDHSWIEPGETIEDSFFVPAPEHADTVAFRIHLRIVSGGIEWNSDSLVEVADAPKAEAHGTSAADVKLGENESADTAHKHTGKE